MVAQTTSNDDVLQHQTKSASLQAAAATTPPTHVSIPTHIVYPNLGVTLRSNELQCKGYCFFHPWKQPHACMYAWSTMTDHGQFSQKYTRDTDQSSFLCLGSHPHCCSTRQDEAGIRHPSVVLNAMQRPTKSISSCNHLPTPPALPSSALQGCTLPFPHQTPSLTKHLND